MKLYKINMCLVAAIILLSVSGHFANLRMEANSAARNAFLELPQIERLLALQEIAELDDRGVESYGDSIVNASNFESLSKRTNEIRRDTHSADFMTFLTDLNMRIRSGTNASKSKPISIDFTSGTFSSLQQRFLKLMLSGYPLDSFTVFKDRIEITLE